MNTIGDRSITQAQGRIEAGESARRVGGRAPIDNYVGDRSMRARRVGGGAPRSAPARCMRDERNGTREAIEAIEMMRERATRTAARVMKDTELEQL